MLVATANRGGFITLVVGMGGLLFLNRKEIGTVRALQIAVGGASLLLVAAVAVTRLTGFDLLFSRLEEVTATQGGVPQTRALVWPEAWNRFLQVPWFGQGPTWRLPMEHLGATFPGHVYMDYPHSLYLYLLVTVGVAGFVAFGWFFLTLGRKLLYAARHVHYESPYVDGLVRLGPLLVGLFLMDQLRIEFLRPTFGDYQHFVFAFFGLWLGLAHRTPRLESAPEPAMSQAAPASLRPRRATVAARGGGHARNAS
jgi:O-antigen ligase